ncbi:MAG: pitrilysin family protein [Bacteroidota bacterium]
MKIKILVIAALTFLSVQGIAQKETPPSGGEPKNFNLPEKTTFELGNGLSVTLVQYGTIPKATIQAVVKTGNIHENSDQVWLADLMGDLMAEGNVTDEGVDLNDALAKMGGELNVAVRRNTTTISADVLAEFTDDFVKLLAKTIMTPAFPESEVARLKNDLKRQVNVSKTRPQSQANESFQKLIYPEHPYGRVFPTEEMIDSYDLETIKAFYNDNFGAKRTHVYVSGVFDESQVKSAIETAFADWKEGTTTEYDVPEVAEAASIEVLDRPGAPQSTIYFGLPVIDPSDDDYIPLMVTDALLGGSFGSRITANIREDKGYTYSPRSVISDGYRSSVWREQADVTTEFTGATLNEIVKEIRTLQNEPPPKEELDGIKNYMAGLFVLRNSTRGGIIAQLAFLDEHDLPESFLTERVKKIYEVTPEKVNEVMKEYIRPEDMTLVVVGDRSVIDSQLDEFKSTIDNL